MNIRKLINKMESDIKSAKEKGIAKIPLVNFESYHDEVKNAVEEGKEIDSLSYQRDLAFYAAVNASRLERYRAQTKRLSDGFQAVITAGQGALKSGALINGGACVALLAFMGNIITKDPSLIPGITLALGFFGVGLLCAAIATGTTYLTQSKYELKKIKVAKKINIITIIIVSMSYVSFLVGGIVSCWTIYDLGSPKTIIPVVHQGEVAGSDANVPISGQSHK